jgi:hypothetical protein
MFWLLGIGGVILIYYMGYREGKKVGAGLLKP